MDLNTLNRNGYMQFTIHKMYYTISDSLYVFFIASLMITMNCHSTVFRNEEKFGLLLSTSQLCSDEHLSRVLGLKLRKLCSNLVSLSDLIFDKEASDFKVS